MQRVMATSRPFEAVYSLNLVALPRRSNLIIAILVASAGLASCSRENGVTGSAAGQSGVEAGPSSELGLLAFSSNSVNLTESHPEAVITIIRSGRSAGPALVSLSTTAGTATEGSDYVASSGSLSWSDGELGPKSFVVKILDDSEVEDDETVAIHLSGAIGASVDSDGSAILTILDDDAASPPSLVQFTTSTVDVSEGAGFALVSVSRTGQLTGPASARLTTANAGATAGSDYVALDETVSWEDGDGSPQTLTIAIRDDSEVEPAETVAISISHPMGTNLGAVASTTLTILDNDTAPTLFRSYQRLTPEPDWEHTEPDVRVNPADPNHVVVSWMQRTAGGGSELNNCATAVTFDGGATWFRHVFKKYGHVACADVSVAFAPFAPPEQPVQTVYAAMLGYGAPGGVGDGDGASTYEPKKGISGQVYLFRSDDGGRTWSEATVVYDWADSRAPAAFDRPWIAVDHSTGPFRGRIYISDMTVFVQQIIPRVYLKYSDDGGATFSAPIEVDRTAGDTGRSTAFATLAVGADGDVMLVYRSWATGISDDQPQEDGNLADSIHAIGVPENPNGVGHVGERSGEGYCVACFSSARIRFLPNSLRPDPDANFALMSDASRPYTISWNGLPFVVSGAPRNSEENPTFATIAGDPTTPGRFAAAFVESRYSKEAQADDYHHVPPGHTAMATPALDLDISFTWTDDWGEHWSRPVRVNDDPIGNGVIQDRAWLTFDPRSGLPVVAWRDRRNSLDTQGAGNGVMTDLFAARMKSFEMRDWGDSPQSVSQPDSVNLRRYEYAPKFFPNERLSSPLDGLHSGGFTPKSSLSDSFFSIAVGGSPENPGASTIWAVWAPILISQGNNTVSDDAADLESGTRQIMLRIWHPDQSVDLTPVIPSTSEP